MLTSSRAKAAVRRVLRWAGFAYVRARAAFDRHGYVPGLLSIAVRVGDGQYLDECLRSLRAQSYRNLEILVVDDGSDQGAARLARSLARKDLRVRVLNVADSGIGAARNTAINAARGEFVTVVDAGDIVSPDAYSCALGALKESGSDFSVLLYDHIGRRRRPAPAWVRAAHSERCLQCTLDDFPQIQVNAAASSKVYRREFWKHADLRYPEVAAYDDQTVSAAAFARCTHFDVLPTVGVSKRIRDGQASKSPQESKAQGLQLMLTAFRNSFQALELAGKVDASRQRALQVMNNELSDFLHDGLHCDQEYWDLLHELADDLRARTDEETFVTSVRAQVKVLCDLVTRNRREGFENFLRARGQSIERFRTTVTGDGVSCALPISEGAGVPARYLLLTDNQLATNTSIVRAHWDSAHELSVEGWAYILHIDLAAHPTTVQVELVNEHGEKQTIRCEPFQHPDIDEQAKHYYCDYRQSGFRARFDVEGLEGHGPWHFEATIETAGYQRSATLRSVTSSGSAVAEQSSSMESDGYVLKSGPSGDLILDRHRRVIAPPIVSERFVRATSIEAENDVVRVVLDTHGLTLEGYECVLASPTFTVTAGAPDNSAHGPVVMFAMTTRRWHTDGLAIPGDTYLMFLRHRETGEQIPVELDDRLLALLPYDSLMCATRVRAIVAKGGPARLALKVLSPLELDERGPRNQQRLREGSRVSTADRDCVFFRSLYGEVANCNGRAIHEELRRRQSPLELFWSVRDRSVRVPEGGIGIIEGSREWHEIIAHARYQLVNIHQLDWFVKPAGQVMIQTFHGYPYKLMGNDWLRKGNFSAVQISSLERRAREWDYVVSPAKYATPLLESAFLAPGNARAHILEIGYPRNDELLADDAELTRNRVREGFGIGPDQIIVMYAPTFRDYLSVNDLNAKAVDFFDAANAARELGSRFVFLMRGHAFNARTGKRMKSSAAVVDVTDYPDINGLCLASDAAILDYSSLRFDYALTGKPMIFLIPDLAEYDKARGGVIEYGPTAPGPHVKTTREVIEKLADLEELRRYCAPRISRFREEYMELEDGHASGRLVDAVFVPRGDA